MTPPKLTFALPAYKASFLREAIDSILVQSFNDFELVIVNDASPENLDEIVQSYSDVRIRYYRNAENLGKNDLVANWNRCLSYACGEYFVLASDDDIYHKDFAVRMIALLENYPDVNLAHCRMATINSEREIIGISGSCQERESCIEFVHNRAICRRTQMAPDFMCRIAVLRDIGGFVSFPLAWYSDDATWFRLAHPGGVVWAEDILFCFRLSGQNICSGTKGQGEKKLAATELYCKWFKDFIVNVHPENDVQQQLLLTINKQFLDQALNGIHFCLTNESYSNLITLFFSYWGKKNAYSYVISQVIIHRNMQIIWRLIRLFVKVCTLGLYRSRAQRSK